jgi:oligopeptide/dipeptide ABC transporter ATP-binding protein
MSGTPVLRVRGLVKQFPIRQGIFRRQVGTVSALDGIDLDIAANETLGMVGESGCGKTTFGRTVLRLVEPTAGSVEFRGEDVTHATPARMRALRRSMQIVFQDPFASLNPRMPVRDIVAEPLLIHRVARVEALPRVDELLASVGLSPEHGNRYPHEFSGGQRQRIGIARALALEPELVVLDEPVSALDVSVQAQVINLLEDLQDRLGLTYLMIAHDLSVVRHVADRIAVMYLGHLVELTDGDRLYDAPAHPYTHALLSAVPLADPRTERTRERIVLEGDLPSPADPPSGCRFRTRCPIAQERCAQERPELIEVAPGHRVACHFPLAEGETLTARLSAGVPGR